MRRACAECHGGRRATREYACVGCESGARGGATWAPRTKKGLFPVSLLRNAYIATRTVSYAWPRPPAIGRRL